MILNIDFLFTYKYTIRFLLINKIGSLDNTYNIPKIKKLIFYFSLKKLIDLDDVQIYNNFYLLKFFFGKKAFISKNKNYFFLGKWYNNFNIQLIINNSKDIYFLLFYFLNNILPNIDKSFIKKGFFNKRLNIFYFIVKDMNFFSEAKTNLGLFNLKSALIFNIYLLGTDFNTSKILITNTKLNFNISY